MAADGLEKFYLEFVFDVNQIQFNHEGRFYLKFTIQSSYIQLTQKYELYQKIRVQRGEESFYENTNIAMTDVMEQVKPNKVYKFKDHKFIFYLPKGFCKNDDRHDVYLVVEAFQLQEHSNRGEGRRVGEGTFGIYPRTNAPKVKEHAALGENLYKTADRMTLLRTLSTDNINMHCGRLEYMARFRKIHQLPRTEYTSPAPSTIIPTPREPTFLESTPLPPTARSPPGQEYHRRSPTPRKLRTPQRSYYPTNDFVQRARAIESPLPRNEHRLLVISPGHSQVSPVGREQILVIYHGAVNLPVLSNGKSPIPFGSLNTKSNEDVKIRASSTTQATIARTHRPTWEEPLAIQIDSNRAPSESIVLKVCDAETKEILVRYDLPVSYLKPFHHYHLELVQPQESSSSGIRLFATIIRRTPSLPIDYSSPTFVALEVMLRGVKQEFHNPLGGLIAVGRMVADFSKYKNDMLSSSLRADLPADLSVTTVSFPNPHPSSFSVPLERSEGHPQVTLPGRPPEQPIWNHTFMYNNERDKANLFTPGAALVFEYYQSSTVMNDATWRLNNPLGFSVVLLDQHVYRSLVSARGRLGVRVEDVPIQGSILKTIAGRTPTIGIVLRLLVSEQPESLSMVSNLDLLPEMGSPTMSSSYFNTSDRLVLPDIGYEDDRMVLRSVSPISQPAAYLPQHHSPRQLFLQRKIKKDILAAKMATMYYRPFTSEPIKDGELPSHEAVESVLPEYQYIFTDPNGRRPPPAQLVGGPENLTDDFGGQSVHLLDYQMRELEKYRTAVHKMGQDILTLRQQLRELEAQNSGLRRELANYNDSTKLLMDSQDLDGLTKPELAARYVALKRKLTGQTSELKTYRERTQKLQNDLIKKNDQEKQLDKMSHAHKSQNELLQKLQDKANKVRKLEEAIRKQEKVIEKYEKFGGKNIPGNDGLANENQRLREEIAELRYKQPDYVKPQSGDDAEKLELYEKLDKAEGRIMSLERQMTENARKWGRERSDLLVRLQEVEHGFRGSPIGNSYPKLEPVKQYSEPRRYSKPPPKAAYASTYY